MMVDNKRLETVCETTLAALGYELCALEFVRETGRFILRVYIDKGEALGPVSLEDCTRASRDLGTALDVADLIHRAYSLEVSSPGIERPLAKESDFIRFDGKKARVRLRDPVQGRRNFSGILRGVREGRIALECDGQRFELPISEVAKAHLQAE